MGIAAYALLAYAVTAAISFMVVGVIVLVSRLTGRPAEEERGGDGE